MLSDPWLEGLVAGLKPREKMTLSQWAEAKLTIPAERGATPGPFRIGDAVYQRGMLDAITNPENETIIFQTSSQVGKTTILTAVEGYYAEHEPSPQLSAFPTQIVADAYVGETFDPTVRDTEALRQVMTGAKIGHYTYANGYIAFVGANNPRELAMRPIRIAKGDEVDRFPLSSGKEGSPIDLMKRRMTTFHNRKMILASTPLLKASSQICSWYQQSDQRKYMVVCESCGGHQELVWENVIYDKGKEHLARYACAHCGELWDNAEKKYLVNVAEVNLGGWTATAPYTGIVGFHISALYSPWVSLAQIAKEYETAKGDPEKEQTFYNTVLGLPYEGEISSYASPELLVARREDYVPALLDRQVGLITASADVQDDRIEVLTIGWGDGDECWLLDHDVIAKDPSMPQAWADLKALLLRKYRHPGGARLPIFAAAIDSGGHYTQTVYDFAHKHRNLRWFAIRGVAGEGKPIWEKSKARLKRGRNLYLIGTHDAKATIYKRFAIEKPGPGYVHMHGGVTEAFIEQMTVEHAEVEYKKGFPKKTWVKKSGARNEGLDLMVYAYAARRSQNVDIEGLVLRHNNKLEDENYEQKMFELGQQAKGSEDDDMQTGAASSALHDPRFAELHRQTAFDLSRL